jgi:hypothetical protein
MNYWEQNISDMPDIVRHTYLPGVYQTVQPFLLHKREYFLPRQQTIA